jgi:hypothetical protein
VKQDYWLHGSSKTAISHLEERRERWTSWNASPIRQTWVRNYLAYYSPAVGPTSGDTSLIFEGVQGELVRFFTPKARSLIQQQVTLITKQKLAAQCLAQTEGSDVVQDVKLGNAVLDQIIENERCNIKGRELCEGGLVCGAWFLETEWRTDKGKPYTRAENGTIIYTGGVQITPRSVFDVYYDVNISDWDQLPEVEIRTPMVRWDLIAQHPELEQKILKLPSVTESKGPNGWFGGKGRDTDDLVYVYKCHAKPSPSLPMGRTIIYGADDCVFYDDENIYGFIPLEAFIPEKVIGVNCGYPHLTNLLAAQEMYDNSLSAIATNQAQFAVQSVAIPRGGGINVQELNGMRFVSFTPQNVPGGGKPEPLQLTQSSPETFKFSELLDKTMMDLAMIPGAMRGNPPPGVTSGVAIATLSANAMENINGFAMAYFACWEKTLEHAVNCYKKFAKEGQSVTLKGRNNQLVSRKFKGEELDCISGVKIQIANPLLQTIAGRLEIGEKLMGMPRELWPQYVSVLEGRPIQEIYKGELSQEDLIFSENELLSQGQAVPALASDDHGLHAKQHADMLNDPAVRMNGSAIEVILTHIEEHMKLAQTTDPYFLAMIRTGKVPEGQPQPPGGPAGPGGPPPGLGLPADGQAQPADDLLQRNMAG